MRLIKTGETISTGMITFRDFVDEDPPEYAILSHTWGDDEVTLQDALQGWDLSNRAGHAKIIHTCRLASSSGIDYAWVDTCCIDKSSSAELSEAINSMFTWYERSSVAYAYLADWRPLRGFDREELRKCRWFRRGWTLQELIAPMALEFYTADWALGGTKAELIVDLSFITGVDRRVLEDPKARFSVHTCVKMSWAAHRETRRKEDVAYSLLGIFDIKLPLLYGEGQKAFVRFQEAILAKSRDATLFAWRSAEVELYSGVLARKPAEFAEFADPALELEDMRVADVPPEWALTNYGLRTTVALRNDGTVLSLGCKTIRRSDVRRIGIYIVRTRDGTYVRHLPREFAEVESTSTFVRTSHIYLETETFLIDSRALRRDSSDGRIVFRRDRMPRWFWPVFAEPNGQWDLALKSFVLREKEDFFGCIAFAAKPLSGSDFEGSIFWVICDVSNSTDQNKEAWMTLATQETHPGILSFSKDMNLLRVLAGRTQLHKVTVSSTTGRKQEINLSFETVPQASGEIKYVVKL